MDRAPSGWIGSVLENRWRIDGKIARGGVATVYKGLDLQTQTKVAIKIMHPEFARNQDARGRFLREGYVANKVGHPLVVKVLGDAVTPDNTVFLVMELLEAGETLEAKRERMGGRMTVDEAVRICEQILDVLVAAHTQDIIHRDIKPENIFVLTDGTVKVLDFGIAHLRAGTSNGESTATGLLLGTPDFMSPEQAMGMRGTIDAASDIYAVGATLFTLVSGEAVHTDMSLASLLHSTSTKQARSLASVKWAAQLPRELIAVVDKALMLQKTQRWPSPRAMQNALHQAVPSAFKAVQVPESSKTRPFSPIDLKPAAIVRPTGKAPMGVKAPSMPPPPISQSVDTPRDQGSPWEEEFSESDMEGPTVATNEFPALKAPPRPRHPTIEPDLLDIHSTQAMTGDLLASVAPLNLTQPKSLPPPPLPPRVNAPGGGSIPPPPPKHLNQTGPNPALPGVSERGSASIPPPPPKHLQQTGPNPSLPRSASIPPPPPQHGSMPPPPQNSVRGTASMPPPPQHGSMPPPPQYYSGPPPPFAGPPTPRNDQWGRSDSGGVAILQQAPSMPPPLPMPMPMTPSKPTSKKKKAAKKPPSIIIAEIVLALLVVVTLTIGGCLLLQSR